MKRVKLPEPSSNQMRNQSTLELVKLHCFVQATRDSGYKSAANALAELVDNAIEAEAEVIDIEIASANDALIDRIAVSANGTGMSRSRIRAANTSRTSPGDISRCRIARAISATDI